MSPQNALKTRIIDALEGDLFFAVADAMSHETDQPGTPNKWFAGFCADSADAAMERLNQAGLETLALCSVRRREGKTEAYHHCLKVRDPQSGVVVYYDPTAEQFGVIGAHREVFTREETEAFNRQHGTDWLARPVLCNQRTWKIPATQAERAKISEIREKWGPEIEINLLPEPRRNKAGKKDGFKR